MDRRTPGSKGQALIRIVNALARHTIVDPSQPQTDTMALRYALSASVLLATAKAWTPYNRRIHTPSLLQVQEHYH